MALNLIKCNFSSGEIAPILNSRGDVVLYQNGAKAIENMIPLIEGGLKKRHGTKLVSTFASGDALRVIPFSPTGEDSYIVVLGNGRLTVFKIVGNTATSVFSDNASPYLTADIQDVQYVYSEYALYFTHEKYPPRALSTNKDFSSWSVANMIFDIPPMGNNPEYRNAAANPTKKEIGEEVFVTSTNYAPWIASANYIVGDKVTYNGRNWECLLANTNSEPTAGNSNWLDIGIAGGGAFVASDVGSIISINGGMVRVTKFNSSLSVSGIVVKALNSIITAIARSWSITKGAFSATSGYPRCVTFFKQRLVFANTKQQPNTVWFSRVGATNNFLETTDDGDAFSIAPASDRSDDILYLVQTSGGIAVLTGGSEFFVRSDGAIGPTTVNIDDHTFYGSFPLFRPVRVGNEVLFTQRGGMRMRALSYRYEVDGLVSPDVSVSASHIPEDHAAYYEGAYQQEPYSVVWVRMGDGTLSCLTINRDQEVLAWSRHNFTDGAVVSLLSLSTLIGFDRVFLLVKRGSNTYLEVMDSSSTLDFESSVVPSNGLITLPAQYASVDKANIAIYQVIDGKMIEVMGEITPTGFDLKTTEYDTMTLTVGIRVKGLVSLLPPELAQAPSTSKDGKISIKKIIPTVYKSLGLVVNGRKVDDMLFKDNILDAQKPFNRRIEINETGWVDVMDFNLTVEHSYPFPLHLQAVEMRIEMNEK